MYNSLGSSFLSSSQNNRSSNEKLNKFFYFKNQPSISRSKYDIYNFHQRF